MTGFGAFAAAEDVDDSDVRWSGSPRILGPPWLQLPALTISFLGVQVFWSVEMTYGSPYLISLGLSKSLTAVAFLAGPLSGLIVQPLIGAITDHSKSRFGRRRPYMLLATAFCVISMLLLGFTKDFVSIFVNRESSLNNTLTILLAVLALYGVDFSINAVQAVDRALIVDTLPFSQQNDGNAWAARMLGLGSVLGFFIGNLNLHDSLGTLGRTQLEVLATLAVLLLFSTQLLTAITVKEKILISSSHTRKGLREEVQEIWDNVLNLPRIIREICIIQFLAWLAWFPVLFYTSVYVGDLYKRSQPPPADHAAAAEQDEYATILGSRAFFYFGLVSLFANFVLPLFVKTDDNSQLEMAASKRRTFLDRLKVVHICELWAFSHLLFAACMMSTFFITTVHGASFFIAFVGLSWAMTQWAPFSLLAEEILVSSQNEAYDDDDLTSIRLVDARSPCPTREGEVLWDANESGEHQRLMIDETTQQADDSISKKLGIEAAGSPASSFEDLAPDVDSDLARVSGPEGSNLLGNAVARQSHVGQRPTLPSRGAFDDRGGSGLRSRPSGLQAKSGIILGIHNLFIVIPQFISTGLSSLLFAIFDPKKVPAQPAHNPGIGMPNNGTISSMDANFNNTHDLYSTAPLFSREEVASSATGVNSVAIIFRIGGISSLVAFVLCWRLARELKRGR